MIADNTLEQVRQLPLINFIQQFTKLRRNGSSYTGLCPLHDEKTPSFSVHPTKGYKCFGCGAGGSNAIDFAMAYERLNFADAVERVAALAGIDIESQSKTGIARPAVQKARNSAKAFQPTIIPEASVKQYSIAYSRSFLYNFFVSRFGTYKTDKVFELYGVGACSRWTDFAENATTLFFQKDILGRIRQLNAIVYDPTTGKRRKDKGEVVDRKTGKTSIKELYPPNRLGLPHLKRMGIKESSIELVQCFFGEHLLQGNNKPAAIVESEKTAMIASLYYPQYVWLATGGSFGVGLPRPETWGILKGRQVVMFPDTDKRIEWLDQAAMLKEITGEDVEYIDITNGQQVPPGKEKYDLADLLLDLPSEVVIPKAPYEVAAPCTFHIGCVYHFPEPELKGLQLTTLQLSDGRLYDCLMNTDESFVTVKSSAVKEIEEQYKKFFHTGNLYGYNCLFHSFN